MQWEGMKEHYSVKDSNPKMWKIQIGPSPLSWREKKNSLKTSYSKSHSTR